MVFQPVEGGGTVEIAQMHHQVDSASAATVPLPVHKQCRKSPNLILDGRKGKLPTTECRFREESFCWGNLWKTTFGRLIDTQMVRIRPINYCG